MPRIVYLSTAFAVGAITAHALHLWFGAAIGSPVFWRVGLLCSIWYGLGVMSEVSTQGANSDHRSNRTD